MWSTDAKIISSAIMMLTMKYVQCWIKDFSYWATHVISISNDSVYALTLPTQSSGD